MGRIIQRARAGKFDTLWNLLPFMVLAAELYRDPETRKGLEFIFSTVDSADDVLSWIDYLALPTDGWDEDGAPPRVDAFSSDPVIAQTLPLSWLVPGAHANVGKTVIRRVATKALGKTLQAIAKQVTKQEAKNLPDALRILRKQLDDLEIKDFRRFVHSKEAVKASAYMLSNAGQRALQNFVRGQTNMRYSPAMVTGMMAYLGWEASCGLVHDYQSGALTTPDEEQGITTEDLGCDNDITFFDTTLRNKLAKKISTVFADSINSVLKEENSKKDDSLLQSISIAGSGHGALFHLNQLAFYQLQHRLAGGKPVKGIEMARRVAFFNDATKFPDQNRPLECDSKSEHCISQRLRYVDIVLGERGIDDAALDKPEDWIELKSYAAQSDGKGDKRYKLVEEAIRGDFTRWKFLKKNEGSTMHKQYSMDLAASRLKTAWLTPTEGKTPKVQKQQTIGNFEWRFQAFKTTPRSRSGSSNNAKPIVSPLLGNANRKGSLRALFSELPNAGAGETNRAFVNTSFGKSSPDTNNVQLVTSGTVLKDLIRAGFDDAVASALEETVETD